MILVTFAMPFEGRSFEKNRRNEVSVLYTGVGIEKARRSLESWLVTAENPPRLIISAGFAGGLDPALGRGDLVLDFREPDTADYQEKLHLAGIECHFGKIYTSAGILDNPEFRRIVHRETGSIAVDMETSAIREAVQNCHIPVLGLRVVTDSVNEPLPVPADVLFDIQTGKPNLIRLAGYLAMRPWKIPAMIRFGKDCDSAGKRLAAALAVLLNEGLP